MPSISKTAKSHKSTTQKRGPRAAPAKPSKVGAVEAVPPQVAPARDTSETGPAHVEVLEVAEVAPVPIVPTPSIVGVFETVATTEVVPPGFMRRGSVLPVIAELPISSIRLDGGTQSRTQLNKETIDEYAEAMTAAAQFPPVVVFFDGKTRWLADGFHRVNASLKIGCDRIACEVRQGSQRDAILCSLGANATHGLPRSNADKRRAVELLVGDPKWSKNSDRWIAKAAGVSDPFVGKLRPQLQTVSSSTEPRIGQDGKARKLPSPKPKSASFTPASVASPVATAPTDEASALADLQVDLERHMLAWTWGPEAFGATLEAWARRVRDHFQVKETANG